MSWQEYVVVFISMEVDLYMQADQLEFDNIDTNQIRFD